MNHNIEVINKNLWAVRFSLIPFIKEIEYISDKHIPAYEEPIRITKDGLMILNKDHKGYSLLKNIMIVIIKKSDRKIKKEINKNDSLNNEDTFKILYTFCLKGELERREKERRK